MTKNLFKAIYFFATFYLMVACTKDVTRPDINNSILNLPPGVIASNFVKDNQGNWIVVGAIAGQSPELPPFAFEAWIGKLSAQGALLWQKKLLEVNSSLSDVYLTKNNELIVIGIRDYLLPKPRINLNIRRNVFIRLDQNGNLLSSRIFPDTTSNNIYYVYYTDWHNDQLVTASFNESTSEVELFNTFDKDFNILQDTLLPLGFSLNGTMSGSRAILHSEAVLGKLSFNTVNLENNQFINRIVQIEVDSLKDWELQVSAFSMINRLSSQGEIFTDVLATLGSQSKFYWLYAQPHSGNYWLIPSRGSILTAFMNENKIHVYFIDDEGKMQSSIFNKSDGTAVPLRSSMPSTLTFWIVKPIAKNRMMGTLGNNQLFIWDENF